MIVVGLVEELLAMLNGLLAHFVQGIDTIGVTMTPDYEWVLTPASTHLTSKGEFLVGAVADIATYGAILVDWTVQALIGVEFQLNEPAT
ncbi:MAG: hypothetical protein NTX81_02070 [Candidatus Bathyarchaeota archaeon]|nr:hypothetical protein [Candidatus Bathyarchaeota archaeon]